MPTIHRYLSLSTAHLEEKVARNMLEDGYIDCGDSIEAPTFANVSARESFGVLGHILPVVEGEGEDEEWPKCIRDCLAHALKHGCDYIRFDRDGEIDPELPTYGWVK